MKKNRKKTSRERRVLVVALLVAALIVSGSTFAWFTSKDEVTNRLSASADYGVSIAESFHAPQSWIPGQEINKDAAATNTGNVDAFVRMYLSGSMRLLKQSKAAANTNAQWNASNGFETLVAGLNPVQDENMLSADLTKLDANGNYFKTLDKSQTKNPKTSTDTNNDGYAQNENYQNTNTGAYSEVQSMQSSILAYADPNAEYCFVLDEEAELEIYLTSEENGASVTGYKKVRVPAGTLVMASEYPNPATITDGMLNCARSPEVTVTSTSGATHAYTNVVYIRRPDDNFAPQNVEYESFTPLTDGLFLFLRNEKDADQTQPEFSGYYVDGVTGHTPADGIYYALNTGVGASDAPFAYRSDYTVRGAESDGVSYDAPITVTYDASGKNIVKVAPSYLLELFNAQYDVMDATKLHWYFDVSAQDRFVVLYDEGTENRFDENTDIAVIITLANVGTTAAEQWTAVCGGSSDTLTNVYDYSETGNPPISVNKVDPNAVKFYYNNDLEAGDTTVKLVDKVKMYEGVKNTAYLAFDFDLNVHLDSVQVTYDENGKEADTAVADGKGDAWKPQQGTGGATGLATVPENEKEITKVAWTGTIGTGG